MVSLQWPIRTHPGLNAEKAYVSESNCEQKGSIVKKIRRGARPFYLWRNLLSTPRKLGDFSQFPPEKQGQKNKNWTHRVQKIEIFKTVQEELGWPPTKLALALRVALYEELLEEVLSALGVDWAWAEKKAPSLFFSKLDHGDPWSYKAIFIVSVITQIIRDSGVKTSVISRRQFFAKHQQHSLVLRVHHKLPVNGFIGQTYIRRKSLTVFNNDILEFALKNGGMIPLIWSSSPSSQMIWTLSHLRYPLVQVEEGHHVYLGTTAEHKFYRFIRNACLVDVHDPSTRIIFLTSTKTTTQYSILGNKFSILHTNHHFDVPAGLAATVYDFDDTILEMVEHHYTLNANLRILFEDYSAPLILAGINWLEIDTILTSLVVRYHPRVEVLRSFGRTEIICNLVANVRLKNAEITYIDDPNDPLHLSQITWTEHRPFRRKHARANPMFRLGEWRQWAEGLGDELAYPPNDPRSRRLWHELVGKASWVDTETLPGFVVTFSTKQVTWDWAVNLAEPSLGQETLSGTRTPSYARPNLWTNGKLIQIGNGEDTPMMDSLLNRINLLHATEIPPYRSHPDLQGRSEVVFLLETSQ
ncbi:hypothetical protein RUM44_005654 [Polyplax serrata]|uniref:Uncharacterized protein n=1 Tax=Polyplax serrata TaxID=468196 RepID=A0ABR1AD38_POLSC